MVQLPDQLIAQFFPGPLRHWQWTPPQVNDFSGPDDLAALLISYRQKLRDIRQDGGQPVEGVADLPDASLSPLLTVAYRASFLKEEGRPVRACLYAPPTFELEDEGNGSLPFPEVARVAIEQAKRQMEARISLFTLMQPLLLDDPKLIARFAPTLAADDAVLVVREREGKVFCASITLMDLDDAQNDLLRMPRGWQGVGGLFVHILGPGELRVSEGHCEYTLRANQIRIYLPAHFAKPVAAWLEEMSSAYEISCSRHPDWDPRYLVMPTDGVVDLMILWGRVLRQGVQMNHGGAFVVVPDVRAAPVNAKYPLSPFDLGNELRESWLSVCRVWRALNGNGKDRVVDLLDEKRRRIHRLCSASRSIGHLSATDGCVLFDRTLTLHGFGGNISVADAPPKRCIRIQGEMRSETSEAELLLPFSNRHQSAYRLCKHVPKTLAFVISQDGDLRLFASDESAVYLYDSLHP